MEGTVTSKRPFGLGYYDKINVAVLKLAAIGPRPAGGTGIDPNSKIPCQNLGNYCIDCGLREGNQIRDVHA